MAIYGTLGEIDLGALDASVTDTAVDIFVYDTRKDSDGGAWRKRTQHTSWYNETLNTATRGSRRDFPAVAIIVSTSSSVKIYDGDDPDMPMWIIFNQGGIWPNNNVIGQSGSGNITSVFALNGKLTLSLSSDGIRIIDFAKDFIEFYWLSYYRTYKGSISQRNSSTGWTDIISPYGTMPSVACNDVSMTVFPNAPIDSVTGLPIPTIAVASTGGVSVIKDDGTVVNIVSSYVPTDNSDYVEFTKSGGLVLDMGEGGDRAWLHTFNTIPSSDTTITVNTKNAASGLSPVGWYDVTLFFGADLQILSDGQSDQIDSSALYGDTIVATTGLGMTLIAEYAYAPSRGMTNFITTSYNTGWMNGSIKGAWLSDTSTASVTGTALLTGQASTYDVNTTNGGWTSQPSASNAYNATNGVGGTGCIRLTSSGGSNVWNSLNLGTVVSGAKYSITFSAKIASSAATSFTVSQFQDSVTFYGGIAPTVTTSHVTYSFIFTASSTTAWFNVYAGNGTGSALDLDNIDVRLLAEPDRSVNNNGLAVYGTITKSAVATGAELVAYSGFSNNANYLYRPYSTDIQIGTNDACYMGWFNTSNSSASERMVVSFEGAGTYGTAFNVRLESDHKLAGWVTNNNFSSSINVKTSQTVNDGVWHHFAWIKTSGTYSLYVDGKFANSGTYSNNLSYTNNNEAIIIGVRNREKENPFTDGKIALVRFSLSAPSAEQIKKIYEDEKVLFQENAACTLYGSSDAVTALAYDDSTNLLYAGTSSGRSDFQGLRRINNTTTAVTTAISASNGLVAEQ